jgi:hypothetical protein
MARAMALDETEGPIILGITERLDRGEFRPDP